VVLMDKVFLSGRRKNGDPMYFDVAKDPKVLCSKNSIYICPKQLRKCIVV